MIKIVWNMPYWQGEGKRLLAPTWPDGWPVPRVGDQLRFDGIVLYVQDVIWIIDTNEPYAYVSLGPGRTTSIEVPRG